MEWRVRVRGKQRPDIDVALVIRALIMIARSMDREQQEDRSPGNGGHGHRADASQHRGEASAR